MKAKLIKYFTGNGTLCSLKKVQVLIATVSVAGVGVDDNNCPCSWCDFRFYIFDRRLPAVLFVALVVHSFTATVGINYLLYVFVEKPVDAPGLATFSLQMVTNRFCENAIPVNASIATSFSGAIFKEEGMSFPRCNGSPTSPLTGTLGAWYKMTGIDAALRLSTCATPWDTYLKIYVGNNSCVKGIDKIETTTFNDKKYEFLIYHDGTFKEENPYTYEIEREREFHLLD